MVKGQIQPRKGIDVLCAKGQKVRTTKNSANKRKKRYALRWEVLKHILSLLFDTGEELQ